MYGLGSNSEVQECKLVGRKSDTSALNVCVTRQQLTIPRYAIMICDRKGGIRVFTISLVTYKYNPIAHYQFKSTKKLPSTYPPILLKFQSS